MRRRHQQIITFIIYYTDYYLIMTIHLKPRSCLCGLFFICIFRISLTYATEAAMTGLDLYSFSYEKWNSRHEEWRASNGLSSKTISRLSCVTDTPSTTIIRRLKSPDQLTPLNRTDHLVFYYFGEITCGDMGAYVCDDGWNHTKLLDLGILNCKPHLCNRNVNQTKILARRNQPILLCVVAYPAITGIEIVNQRNRKSTEIDWTYSVKPRTEFSMHTLNITLTSRSPKRPGQNSVFNVIVLHATEPEKQTLDVILEPANTDENPANVTIQTTPSTTPPAVSNGRLREYGDSSGVIIAVAVAITVIVVVVVFALISTRDKWLPKLRQLQHNPSQMQEDPDEPGVTRRLTGIVLD